MIDRETERPDFKQSARAALRDPQLQRALGAVEARFVDGRAAAVNRLPEFEALRNAARDIKDHTLSHLDLYLEAFEKSAAESGGHVHFARTAEEACKVIIEICEAHGAKTLAKGKSITSEEIDLNPALVARGLQVMETDLGEYIIQLRNERPSHIVAPAAHLSREQVERDFRHRHTALAPERDLSDASKLMGEARTVLRETFLSADVGLTGANFLVAETGSAVIVTNEGNGDLSQTLPKTHIVLASIEKLVPTLEDAAIMLRVLARSATGQDMTVYTTFSTGPRRPDDPEGPRAFHIVLVDNGRSAMLGGEFNEMLRCIRCGACMNHCPVYQSIGGHAYGSVYPGPMGAVFTPSLFGLKENSDLPNASTFCGRCEEVCPVRIPLPKLMRFWRNAEHERLMTAPAPRRAFAVWAFFAKRPSLYRASTALAAISFAFFGRRRGVFRWLPFAAAWVATRDMPVPEGPTTFQHRWRAGGRR